MICFLIKILSSKTSDSRFFVLDSWLSVVFVFPLPERLQAAASWYVISNPNWPQEVAKTCPRTLSHPLQYWFVDRSLESPSLLPAVVNITLGARALLRTQGNATNDS